MRQPTPDSGEHRMHMQHRKRIEEIRDAAEQLAATAALIHERCKTVLARGGQLNIQQQMAFNIGVLMRMQKDWGVTEQLQQLGVMHKPRAIDDTAALNGARPRP